MKIEAIGDEKILVNLSSEDMKELDITYDEMDYGNIETRRVIWTILDEAGKKLGIHLYTDKRLLIEAAPDDNGGCVMMFTVTDTTVKNGKNLVMKKEKETLIWQTENENIFLDALLLLKNEKEKILSATWYRYRNAYFCVLEATSKYVSYWEILFSEYGTVEEDNKYLFGEITEHGIKLANC